MNTTNIEAFIDGSEIIPGDEHCMREIEISKRFGTPQTGGSGGDNAINGLRHLHGAIKDAWREIGQFKHRLSKDELLSDAVRDLKLAEFAKRKLDNAEAKYNDLAGKAEVAYTQLNEALTAKLEPSPARAIRDVEFRSVVRAMGDAERQKFINEVRSNADLDAMRALANGHEVTTGIPTVTRNHLKAKYLEAVAPEEMERLRLFEDGLERVEKAKEALIQHTYGAVNFNRAQKLREKSTG